MGMLEDSPVIVENGARFDDEEDDRDYYQDDGMLIQYGAGPVPNGQYQTPAPKAERERKSKKDRSEGKDDKKDKKRKRLHVDTAAEQPRDADEAMTDAPPVLHSGLTGGLNRLLSRPSVFPPSPDYSGGDVADASPGSPLKRSKHSKREKEGRVDKMSNTLMALISSRKSKDADHDDERPRKHRSSRRHRTETTPKGTKTKMIEYTPLNGAVTNGHADSQLVLYQDRAELFMSFVDKGPQSERGCSMNKALKRYHRERTTLGMGRGKGDEEKELWRSLRLKRNDRGEIVLFLP
jgi:cell growth-regulating nucleolar protein